MLGEGAGFGCDAVEDFLRVGAASLGLEVLDGGPVVGEDLEDLLGVVDALLASGVVLFGALVGFLPGDVALLGEVGVGGCGVSVSGSDGVDFLHAPAEAFFFEPLVECPGGIVEGDELFGDLVGEVGCVLAQVLVLGGGDFGLGFALEGFGVGGVEPERPGLDPLGEVGGVLVDDVGGGEAAAADGVELGLLAQGVSRK
ncbi:hypothetical protein ACODT5_38555 [Streptomyces sp. 5.8]|uniref:hypothetical protein n=1 Tax=Streptomyces sp. 5.8 TaxID=3406571 RepID=UPI003BB64681